MRPFLVLILIFFSCLHANEEHSILLGSRIGDPSSLVENVSVIHGDYTELEVDVTVAAPDPIVLSRFYSSKDPLKIATFGGWRFLPHCYLSVKRDPNAKSYTTSKGTFERTIVRTGNPDGAILSYVGWQNANETERTLFKIEVDEESLGIANTAKGIISSWTNSKNNEIYFDPQVDTFELFLASLGKRFYAKHPSLDGYLITHEILPSGNKIFYEFNEAGQICLIKETNASENKVLAWIQIDYEDEVQVVASDGQTAQYQFEKDPSGYSFLSEVIRPAKPSLKYQYQMKDDHALLLKKIFPEGRNVCLDYYGTGKDQYKVESITAPIDTESCSKLQFFYEENKTRVEGPGTCKTDYSFDDHFQLTEIGQYLDGSLYRIHRKNWGINSDEGNLISTSIEDASGNIFYYKRLFYDREGNITEEREYGNFLGLELLPLRIDEEGNVKNQDGQIKYFSFFIEEDTYGYLQHDVTGAGVKHWFKKGTNLLVKKAILAQRSSDSQELAVKERHFYTYNDDVSLVKVVIDSGQENGYWCGEYIPVPTECYITEITPKQELPNLGAPQIIEERYSRLIEGSLNKRKEGLLKKVVNEFDSNGNLSSQSIYDENETYCYTVDKKYSNGLLIFETDPLGNVFHYSYDANCNLILETHSNTGLSIEYGYDLKNRPIFTLQKDKLGNIFRAEIGYDSAGYKCFEVDRFGHKTIYRNDSLGRAIEITHPTTTDSSPTYFYTYDLFDHPTTITDPKGRVLTQAYTVLGKPTEISHLNGTKEIFQYNSAGNLHKYFRADGILEVFEYDYKGRLEKLQYFARGSSSYPLMQKICKYNTFHKISETDLKGEETTYSYSDSGKLAAASKAGQKVEWIYDFLGRNCGVKKWKDKKAFSLENREFDFLDRVLKERIEDETGKMLFKKRLVYDEAGLLAEVIGYPQNEESILFRYEYDGFGRLSKVKNATGLVNTVTYNDHSIDERGQKIHSRTWINPLGIETEEVFDAEEHLIRSTKKDSLGKILYESGSLYDVVGNKILDNTLVLQDGKSSKNFRMEFVFNQSDQTERFIPGKDSNATRYEYNAYGEKLAKYSPNSKDPIKYQYDSLGDLHQISYRDDEKICKYEISYDNHKNITRISDSHFTIQRSFDPFDRMNSEKIKDSFGSYQVECSYDGEGKIKKIKLPDQSYVEYKYQGPFVQEVKYFSKEKAELLNFQVVARDLMGNIFEENLPGILGSRKQSWDRTGKRIEIATDFFRDRVPDGGYDLLENITRRETTLDGKQYFLDYEYNLLSQLVSEKGGVDHKYAYDSIGNRLKKDDFSYLVNDLNQLIDTQQVSFTFDSNGNLATKKRGDRIWTFISNPLNQLTKIEDSEGTVIHFGYDPSGKRLSKRVTTPGKKEKVHQFFYLGDTEIGAVDEKGSIVELKIPSDPNQPESPCIAIQIQKELYVPIYDLKGNIVCLLHPQKRKVIESYSYTAYGEEMIFNQRGNQIAQVSALNPWRYRGKRVDAESGLIYFGYRYYDPEVGRWTSPDPLGLIDGPNLYAYANKNPLKYIDYFGLATEIDENCGCVVHGHPGWHKAPAACVCICDRGGLFQNDDFHNQVRGDVRDALTTLSAFGHRAVDVSMRLLYDFQIMAAYWGAGELGIGLFERLDMIESIEESQVAQKKMIDDWYMDALSIDKNDMVYRSIRSITTTTLEIGSLFWTGYGLIKGGMAWNRLAKMPMQMNKAAKIGNQLIKWPSPGGRRAIVNGIEYTTHALERMAPRGLIQNGTEIISRGVPPSAVENAIKFGTKTLGNTPQEMVHIFENVRVVTNLEATKVITVITTGK